MYSIFGSIIDKDKSPKKDLKVVAYDDDPLWFDDKLGEDVTNEKGFFKIEFDKPSFDGFAEGRPDIFLIIKDANDNELLKTRVKKTRKQVEYHIKLAEHTPDPNALDIYAGNLSKVMKNFQNIGDFIDSENAFAPEQREKLRDNLNSVMAMLNGTIHLFFESSGIDTIGYDGAQVPKQPRRKKYNQAVIWPRDETWE